MISIALATYNGEEFLREQLDSVLNQTFQDFEIIVCDDCSTDHTLAILEEYKKRDARITVYQNDYRLLRREDLRRNRRTGGGRQ